MQQVDPMRFKQTKRKIKFGSNKEKCGELKPIRGGAQVEPTLNNDQFGSSKERNLDRFKQTKKKNM